MLFEGVPYAEYVARHKRDWRRDALRSFVDFIERKLGVIVIYPTSALPAGKIELAETYEIAETLKKAGVIDSLYRVKNLPDEPSIRQWECICADPDRHISGGLSVRRDSDALYAALAEGLERYLWYTQRDYFRSPRRATVAEIARIGRFIPPERFVGFSSEQRSRDPAIRLERDASYWWTRGVSLLDDKDTYIPAQTVSRLVDPLREDEREPLIRGQSTIGLATWPTKAGARLAAALEIIEHDAYMIMWLNQLTLPRIRLDRMSRESAELDTLIARCARYRLKVHAIRMITDAPAHAVCAIIEDESGIAPRFTMGLSAHSSLVRAIEKALLEALRARAQYRKSSPERRSQRATAATEAINHRERLFYWGLPEHASGLEFLIRGSLEDVPEAEWERDEPEVHLERIVGWCREKNYECAAVSLGTSAKNPTSWHVERLVMPDLQVTHLNESRQHIDGKRLSDVPRLFDYAPAAKPFSEIPHPF